MEIRISTCNRVQRGDEISDKYMSLPFLLKSYIYVSVLLSYL